jgi:hypothetical protein
MTNRSETQNSRRQRPERGSGRLVVLALVGLALVLSGFFRNGRLTQ